MVESIIDLVFQFKRRKKMIEYLKKFEPNFKTAIENGYSRHIPYNDRLKLIELYKELTDNQDRICINCSADMVKILKVIYNDYYLVHSKEETKNELVDIVKDGESKQIEPSKLDWYKTRGWTEKKKITLES